LESELLENDPTEGGSDSPFVLQRITERGRKPQEPAMKQLDAQLMLTRARKAGVRIADLYSALAYCSPEHTDYSMAGEGQVDANGYHRCYDSSGHVRFRQDVQPGR
jgi:hypothetical protein